jgi:DNA-binding NarL/FixJ family response regulator
MSTTILLADDHQVVRQGLHALLTAEGFRIVAEASNGVEALQQAAVHQPEIAVLDISMPVMNGLEAAREMTRESPRTRTILLTRHEDDQYVVASLKAGVRGYVLKSQAAHDLVQAVKDVRRGDVYLSPSVSRTVIDVFLSKNEQAHDRLTARERQVIQLIGEEKTTKEIANILGISAKTAESHRSRLMQKLDIHGTAGLVRYAIRRGLIEP